MSKLIKHAFIISLVGFIFLGILLVLGQTLGLILQNGTLIINSSEYLSTTAFSLSAIAAILGFILHYIERK